MQPVTSHHDVSNFSEPLDILAGPTDAERVFADLARVRKNISVEETGDLAGLAVLDQFRAASAVTTAKPWSLNSILSSNALLAAGLAAAVALDVGIMGGSFKDVIAHNVWLWPIGAGSIVYGIALGETKSDGSKLKHGIIGAGTFIACFMAAVSLSGNSIGVSPPATKAITQQDDTYWRHFIGIVPDGLNAQSDKALTALNSAKAKLALDTKQYNDKKDQVDGNPQKHIKSILTDGNPDNDKLDPIYRAELPKLEDNVVKDAMAVEEAKTAAIVAQRNNPAQRLARYIAAVAFGVPLFVSMLFVGHVLGRARQRHEDHKEKAIKLKKFQSLVKELGNPVSMRARATQEVTKMLQRMNGHATRAAEGDSAKLEMVENLFTGTSYRVALETGTDLVCGVLTGEHEWQKTAPGLHARTTKWREEKYGNGADEATKSPSVDATPDGLIAEKPAAASDNTGVEAGKPNGEASAAKEAVAGPAAEEAPTQSAEAGSATDLSGPSEDRAKTADPIFTRNGVDTAKSQVKPSPLMAAETAAAPYNADVEVGKPNGEAFAAKEAAAGPAAEEASTQSAAGSATDPSDPSEDRAKTADPILTRNGVDTAKSQVKPSPSHNAGVEVGKPNGKASAAKEAAASPAAEEAPTQSAAGSSTDLSDHSEDRAKTADPIIFTRNGVDTAKSQAKPSPTASKLANRHAEEVANDTPDGNSNGRNGYGPNRPKGVTLRLTWDDEENVQVQHLKPLPGDSPSPAP